MPLIYLNQLGGQDELVFDGGSFALHGDRTLAVQLPVFRRAWRVTMRRATTAALQSAITKLVEGEPGDYATACWACAIPSKNGFPGVVLGVSGGIDSALCAAIAVDALGPERVRCVMLPYRYTAQMSIARSRGLRQPRSPP